MMWCLRRKHQPRTILRLRDDEGQWQPCLFDDPEARALISALTTYGGELYDVIPFPPDKPLPPKVVRTTPRSRV